MASLADLQTERETLRAAQAKADFEAAHAQTCSQPDLIAAGAAVRAVLLDAIDSMAARFLDAIRGERDETRVHYLMSDAAHDLLGTIGETAAKVSTSLPIVGERVKRGVKPRDLLTVSQWADRHRELKSGTNAPGRWHTALTPYLEEIMDSLSEHSAVRQVTFIKSSGVGGTEVIFNWIGYIMQHLANKDLLVVMPTLELRDRSFNPRLAKMLDESAGLADLVNTASRNKANRGDLLEYGARARVIKAGSNSPDSLRSDHLPYVICDEVDAFPWDVGGEGDPMTLIENRQRTYSRAKTYLVSTPTIAGASRIDLQYQRSDRRRYHVPCPHCGELQHLEFGGKDKPHGLKWRTAPKADDDHGLAQVVSAWYVCRECGAEIDEGHKADMLSAGRWIAERPAIRHHRGYHLNALYAPVGLGLNWRAVAQKWIDSQGDTAELKGFVNTYLGEVWKEQGDSIEDISLISRCEDYPENLRATHIALITSFTDVQKDRLETTIVGWGPGEEAWVLDHEIHPGDTARPECWEDLDGYLRAEGVQVAGIDAGYNTSMVQAFVEKRRWCVATKGVAGLGRPLIEDRKKRLQRLRTRRKKGQPLEPLGVDQGKALVYARCKLLAPGPGYIHFPRSAAFDDEWFAQLAAEKLVTKIKGTRPFQEWVQTRPRNEALDCMVGNLAMMRLSGSSLVAEVGAGDTAMQQLVAANAKAKPKPRHPGGFVKGWKA
jgi:phage terminase large subunit GpA-like protein